MSTTPTTTPTLWHYTCEHAREKLGDAASLVPARYLSDKIPERYWPAELIWLTDLAVPIRDALGLTSRWSTCDRTTHRYRVTDTTYCYPWMEIRHVVPNPEYLEAVDGTRPRHWWVARVPVPVVYDPLT